MKKRITALLTTAAMLTSSAAMLPAQAAEDSILGTLPDWVPLDFADAMNFHNEHGVSYIADDIICLVRPMLQFKEDDYDFSVFGSMTELNTPCSGKAKIYELEIPEKPDPNDPDAVAEFEAYCDKLGIYSHDYSFFENYANCKTQYAYEVELFRVLEGYDLTVVWTEKNGDEVQTKAKYSFENKDGTILETDIYGWLPDCEPEFEGFIERYGLASVHDNYIVYCADINYSTGATLKMEQSGEGEIEEVLQSSCSPFKLEPLEGGSSPAAILYRAVSDGNLNVKWTIGQQWSDDPPFEETNGSYEIKENGTVILDHSTVTKAATIFTLVDKDTGELIKIPSGVNGYIMRSTTQGPPDTADIYELTSNPLTVHGENIYNPYCSYTVDLNWPVGRYDYPELVVTSDTTDLIEVTCKLKWCPSGDLNLDYAFIKSDCELLMDWLCGENVKMHDWNAADFCRDKHLTATDLTLMKRKKFQMTKSAVEPQVYTEWGGIYYVLKEGLELYLGPDESYEVVANFMRDEELREYGYQKDNDKWVYVLYQDQYGWIRLYDDDGNANVYSGAVADKPVIYLYPETETDVHVELELTESKLSTTYPKYQDGWDVTAYPDGRLLNKADGTHHRYLFWDSVDCRTRFDYSKGFCIAGSDTERFLKEKLTYMGLTEDEMNEFIVYWLPRMEHNAYNLITFQSDAYTESAKLNISPAPDSICRIFMAYIPLEESVEIEPQQLSTFERNGFTVVEWGGTELK